MEPAPLPALHVCGAMPIPSSTDAPYFDGTKLRKFITNYEMATEEAGWTEEQCCRKLPLYCSKQPWDLFQKLEEVMTGISWSVLKTKIREYYYESSALRYSWQAFNEFVCQDRVIRTRRDFSEYYWEFQIRFSIHSPRREYIRRQEESLFLAGTTPQSPMQHLSQAQNSQPSNESDRGSDSCYCERGRIENFE